MKPMLGLTLILHHQATTTNNLGSLLLGFLRHYGMELKYEDVGFSILQDGAYYSKAERGFFV
jgi:DNA polymerase sigma